jgi:hypothetical protein
LPKESHDFMWLKSLPISQNLRIPLSSVARVPLEFSMELASEVRDKMFHDDLFVHNPQRDVVMYSAVYRLWCSEYIQRIRTGMILKNRLRYKIVMRSFTLIACRSNSWWV